MVFAEFKNGLDAYNQDVERIKGCVSTLRGILGSASKKLMARLDAEEGVSPLRPLLDVILAINPGDERAKYGVRFWLANPTSLTAASPEVTVSLIEEVGGSRGHIPWERVIWSPVSNHGISPRVVKLLAAAASLDKLLEKVCLVAPEIKGVVERLIERGQNEK